MRGEKAPTIGSMFAGIGGFDLGFERAGWRTRWQIEINPINRAVLGQRFPGARQWDDVRTATAAKLGKVDCILAGFPCQDISMSGSSGGKRPGLDGQRSGLFSEVLRLIDEAQPAWVVLENVPALLHSNDCRDIQTVIQSLAQRGYLGCFRVLDSQYFGVPQKRRRLFLVAGLRRLPPLELLGDAGQLESLPCTLGTESEPRPAVAWAGHTLQAENSPGRFSLGSTNFVAHADGWDQMLERARTHRDDGIPKGLDDPNFAQAYSAGNAVVPQVAEWIAAKLIREWKGGGW